MGIACQCHQTATQRCMRLCLSVGTKTQCEGQRSRHFSGSSKTSSPWTKATTRKLTPTDYKTTTLLTVRPKLFEKSAVKLKNKLRNIVFCSRHFCSQRSVTNDSVLLLLSRQSVSCNYHAIHLPVQVFHVFWSSHVIVLRTRTTSIQDKRFSKIKMTENVL